jgi:hypothetical protein
MTPEGIRISWAAVTTPCNGDERPNGGPEQERRDSDLGKFFGGAKAVSKVLRGKRGLDPSYSGRTIPVNSRLVSRRRMRLISSRGIFSNGTRRRSSSRVPVLPQCCPHAD